MATAKLRVASGLSFLKGKKYKIAAQKFTEVRIIFPCCGRRHCRIKTLPAHASPEPTAVPSSKAQLRAFGGALRATAGIV